MRICPACKTQYSDDTLQYCLQDGTPLTGGRGSDTPTVALGETETAVALGGQNRLNVPVADTESATWQRSQVTRIATAVPPAKRSKTSAFIIAAVVLVLFMLSVCAIVVTFLRNFPRKSAANNTNF